MALTDDNCQPTPRRRCTPYIVLPYADTSIPAQSLEIISSLLVSLLRSASACKIAEEFLGSPDRSSSHCCQHFVCHPYYFRERLSYLSSSGATPPQIRSIRVSRPQLLIERPPGTASPLLAATENPCTFDCTLWYPWPATDFDSHSNPHSSRASSSQAAHPPSP
jgi:hypothetical protein